MSGMTRSPLDFARTTLRNAREALPAYSHPNSPRTYTQPQLFTILALRQFLNVDYRRMTAYLREWSDLRRVLGLKRVPDHSTLCYAERRLLKKNSSAGCSISLPTPPGAAD